jgi:hypothetical protein
MWRTGRVEKSWVGRGERGEGGARPDGPRSPSGWRWAVVGLAGLAALGFGLPVVGQEPAELVTDRPDQTESAVVVPVGSVQVESGWAREETDEVTAEAAGSTLVRVGLAERLELRLGWDGWLEEKAAGARISGAGDASLGVKVRLADEGPRRPEVALLVGTSLPVGGEEVTSDRYDPSFRLSLARGFGEQLGLGVNLGMSWASAPGETGAIETASTLDYTAALGIGLTDRLGAFVELFGGVPVDGPGGAAHSFDGGLTFLATPTFQLDVAVGVGLSDDAPDWFVGLGASARFDRGR